MAENTVLSALRNKAVEFVGDTFADQLFVDFTGAVHSGAADSAYNLTSGDTFIAFNLPKGAVVTECGWVCHTTDAGAPTFAIAMADDTSTGGAIVTATAIGSAYAAVCTHDATPIIVADDDGGTIVVTGGTADCDDGIVTFFIKGFVVKRQS